MELEHSRFVKKVTRGTEKYLYHGGTAELVPLGGEARDLELRFDAAGAGYLQADPCVAVNSLLKKLLCRGVHPSRGEEDFVYDTRNGSSKWKCDLSSAVVPRALLLPLVGEVAVQVSVFGIPVGAEHRARVFWGLTDLATALHAKNDYENFVALSMKTIEKTLIKFGLLPSSVRRSRRSLLTQRGSDAVEGIVDMPDGALLQQWTATTSASPVFLMTWASHKSCLNVDRHTCAEKVLDMICKRAFENSTGLVQLAPNLSVKIENGKCNIESLIGDAQGCQALQTVLRCSIAEAHDGHVPVFLFLLHLFQVSRRPSRHKSIPPQQISNYIHALLLEIELQIEISVAEPWWTTSSCWVLAPVKRTTRSRQCSEAYKEAAVEACKSTCEPVKLRQLLGSKGIQANALDTAVVAFGSRAATGAIKRDHCLKVFGASRAAFADNRVLHLTGDGVTAAGRHNEIFVAFRADTRQGTVCPIKFQNAYFHFISHVTVF